MTASDNLLSNIDKVAYTTYFDAEKIVKTFKGSFRYSTDTVTRSYTLAGAPYNVQVFKIAHGFTRPVFVEMLWSLDNSFYVVGGARFDTSGNSAIAYSDSSFVYIMINDVGAGTPVYFRVICSWISDYDDTNPSVPSFQDLPANYTQVLTSRAVIPAVVKRGVINASTSSAFLVNVEGTVAHGLGYSPSCRAYIESFSGEVWPLNYGGTMNPYLVDDDQVEAQIFATTTQFISDMIMKSVNGTRRMWYVLYAKQGDLITGGHTVDQLPI